MRKTNEQTIGEVIAEIFEAYHYSEKFDEMKIMNAWPQVTGKMTAKHTKSLKISNKTLFVSLDSDPLRNELIYSRSKLLALLNKKAGKEVITQIVFR